MKTLSFFILTFFFYAFCISTLSAADWKVYVAKYKQDKTCAISYTFDDGLAEHATVAAPELEKRGFRGTFWVCGYYTEQGASSKLPLRDIGRTFTALEKNDSAIFANIGVRPVTYCYPYNYKTDEIVVLASENRVGTRTRQISIGGKSTPQRFAKWLDDLMKKEEWGVGMTHGINYGYDAFKEPSLFWEHLDKVKSLEDKIWIGTFREVAAYIKERDDVQLNIAMNKKGLTITPEMTLDKNLYTEPLTMVLVGEEVKEVSVKQGKKQLSAHISGDKVIFDFNPYAGKIKVSFNYK